MDTGVSRVTFEQRRGWILASIVLVAAGAVFGATNKPGTANVASVNKNFTPVSGIYISVPSLNQVKSIQVNLNFPTTNPKPITTDTLNDSAEISKLLNWLAASQSVGYETQHAIPMLGPTELDIVLRDGKELNIQPAIDANVEKPATRTVIAMVRSKEYIVLNTSDNTKIIRLYSPELAKWLGDGWKQDMAWKPH